MKHGKKCFVEKVDKFKARAGLGPLQSAGVACFGLPGQVDESDSL